MSFNTNTCDVYTEIFRTVGQETKCGRGLSILPISKVDRAGDLVKIVPVQFIKNSSYA